MRASTKAVYFPGILIFTALSMIALSMPGCSSDEPKVSAELNRSASLAGEFAAGLPANPLQMEGRYFGNQQSGFDHVYPIWQ
jgi:hypothetical protein